MTRDSTFVTLQQVCHYSKDMRLTYVDVNKPLVAYLLIATNCRYSRFYRATACNATHGIAVGILSVCLSVCLSVRCVYCEKTKQRTANILIPHETAITLVF